MARLFVVVVVGVVAVPLVLGVVLTSAIGGWASVGVAIVSWVAIAAVLAAAVMIGVRFWRPVKRIIGTAGRLADGDYDARVGPMGSSVLRPVGSSLDRLGDRLARSEADRRQLLADLGHELRTPLTLLRGELEAMADGVRPIGPDRLRTMLRDVAVMERLLDDLRTLSMAEAGALSLHREPTDVAHLVTIAVERFRATADARGVALGVTVDNAPAVLDLDPVRVDEVVNNLLSNAVSATPPGGQVIVAVTADSSGDNSVESVIVEVADTGRGIPADELERVFDRFHSGTDGGTGLGLTITRNLVEAHGGTIALASTEGEGTTATVRLPTSSGVAGSDR